jgi:gamma-tubulin complex component 2
MNPVHSAGTSLRGVDLFTIDLRINWPINLVLSRTSMVKYQILFKSLFFFKYIERQLNKTWQLHQTIKELGIQGLFIKSHILLQ